ncbi:RNA polymerase sigma factor FliA [Marinobacterium sediminicola]|uniref:RNA polymerase sigma factor FliA n=1 Tax=Marinobacterium sediminicola TaxID=518898 RepID=A0ABY1RY94_9GAMM|nr:RNA polymerase sigma factor FliA [Marinobacterium sediminicola]ULG68755.1 RNA polymerase sigma factor FliA [Marinobacterium sediminicola]SMR73284.1 RNA polymerase, sigma 28 subunit, SigD/FliA/WhiG [Marinobacterium sediminicola]
MYNVVEFKSGPELIQEYTPLVRRIAHHLMARLPSHVVLDDLIQAGMMGLLEAASRYDAGKGASFETYAGIRIRGAIIDEVRRGDWTPRSVHRNARRVSEAIAQVENRTGRDASDSEVAAELGISIAEYQSLLQDSADSRLFSFDQLTETTEDTPAEQFTSAEPEPGQMLEDSGFKQALANAIGGLPERERLVLSLYYDEELNLKEIGQVLGVSESRVSQIHSQAALRLRGRLRDWC